MIWYLFVNSSEKSSKWVKLYTHGNTTVKVKRSEYLEYEELLEGKEDFKYVKQYYNLQYNESVCYTKFARGDSSIVKKQKINYGQLHHLKYKKQIENFIKYLKIQNNDSRKWMD